MAWKLKLIAVLGGVFLYVQCILGTPAPDTLWKKFLFFDVTTNATGPEPRTAMNIYMGGFDVDNPSGIQNSDLFVKSIKIDNTKFSEYVMAALVNIRCNSRIQCCTQTIGADIYQVYRFQPYPPSLQTDNDMKTASYIDFSERSNFHSFGLGINPVTNVIMLEVLLSPSTLEFVHNSPNTNTPVILEVGRFYLAPGAEYWNKAKFDYMVSSLIEYRSNLISLNLNRDYPYIEILRDGGNAIGLRFHTPKPGLRPIP